MSIAKPDSPPTRGCAFSLVCAITALFGFAMLFAVFLEFQKVRWEASKLTRVRDAVAKMKSEGTHRLSLYSTRNVDEQLELIRGMPEIEDVHLWDGVDITAEGMKHIGTLPNLKRFTTSALVGDEGLLALRGCKSLEWVNIYDSNISPEAIAELQSDLPKCDVNTIYAPIEERPSSRSIQVNSPSETQGDTSESN